MAATDYGTGIQALDDLPDPVRLCSGATNAAYRAARRLLQRADAYEEIGVVEEYDCLDLRDYLGRRMSLQDVRDLENACEQVLSEDKFIATVTVSATLSANQISVEVRAEGSEGSFGFVLNVTNAGFTIRIFFPGE
jgi:hypothetical protein